MNGRKILIAAVVLLVIVGVRLGTRLMRTEHLKDKREAATAPTVTFTPDQWTATHVTFYRKLGFYCLYAKLTDAQVLQKLRDAYKDEWGEAFTYDPKNKYADQEFLRYDSLRVWWRDLEADAYKGSNVYTDTLKEWAAISRGAFAPSKITETWKTDDGPVTIAFTLNGKTERVTLDENGGWIDLNLLVFVNARITASGYQFYVSDAPDQAAFIVALTPEEKDAITRERGWGFQPQQ
jgi:hypothetical protein